MGYSMRAITLRNTKFEDKPNEDYYSVDERAGAALLLDGVSRDRENGRYPTPSPSVEANAAFAAAAFDIMCAYRGGTEGETLKTAAKAGNDAVAVMNRGFGGYFLPGTVGILALLKEAKLYYAYIGDCNGAVLDRKGMRYFTCAQTAEVHKRRGEFTSREIREDICNNRLHPCGYGVWNGKAGAADFLRTGEESLETGARVILFSDGFDGLFDAIKPDELYLMSTEKITALAAGFNAPLPMDDRTLIVIG